MAASDKKSPSAPRIPAHPALLSTEVGAWAGAGIAAAGRREALLGRVEQLLLAADGTAIEARVRGDRPLPYRIEVRVDAAGALNARCTCDRERVTACKHAVAAVEALRFPLRDVPVKRSRGTRSPTRTRGRGRGRIIHPAPPPPGFLLIGSTSRTPTRAERLAAAAADEVATCRQLARRQRRSAVTPLAAEPGAPPRFAVADRFEGASFVVTLRGAGRLASCGCADFAGNELGTCWHVERLRMWQLRKPKPPVPACVSFWWQPRPWPETLPEPLRELRVDFPAGLESAPTLGDHFEPPGWLRPRPEGLEPRVWVAEAQETVRAAARAVALPVDLDPRAEAVLEEATREFERERLLAAVDERLPAWHAVRDGLGLRLHPFQERGALFLARRGRAFLADDMGLGKTVQAIAAALLLRRVAGAERALVVCPASLKHQWRREIEKVCGEEAAVVDGPPAARRAAYATWRRGFLVLNYELVLRDLDALVATGAELVILDEAQRIKNWGTETARAVKRLASPCAFVLTGTPLENRLAELHSIVEFVAPRALGPRWRLLPYHAVTESEGRVVAYEGLDVLRARLGHFLLRRERREVLDELPPRTENTFWTDMSPAQQRPYRKVAARLRALLAERRPLTAGEVRRVLLWMTEMRMLCNAWAQHAWDSFASRVRSSHPPTVAERKALGSPKLDEFAHVLDDLLEDPLAKVVVFSQWERMLRLAHYATRDVLARRSSRAGVFHGGLAAKAREELLAAFGAEPDLRVLFSTDAGGLGLNLQDAASIVVHLEVPWNPAVIEQRIARVHRLGQRHSVQVLHFVTRGAIEERVLRVVEGKRALFEGLLVNGADEVRLDQGLRESLVERLRQLVSPGG